MNNKESVLMQIVDIVVDCTTSTINGYQTITRDDLLGKSREDNHVMARAILALQLKHEGYSTKTTSLLLGRTEQSVRKLIKQGYELVASSRACRIAAAEVVLKCREITGE